MGWNGDNDGKWDVYRSQSPAMYYLNYVLLIGCLVILTCALYFIYQECCQSNQRDEETETIIMTQPAAPVPRYTELPYDRDQSHNHRIVHEYNRQSQVPSSSSQVAPHHYYAYDPKHLAHYYMYPTPCSLVTTTATAPFVHGNYGECQPPREDDRPPPYAPNH